MTTDPALRPAAASVPSNGLLDAALDEYAKRGGRMVFWTCPKGCRDIVDWKHDILSGKSVATCRKCGTNTGADRT